MAGNCSKCIELIPRDARGGYRCDGCNNLLCKKCTQLSATEIKVAELTHKKMIFLCTECKLSFQEFSQQKTMFTTELDKQVEIITTKFTQCLEELKNNLSAMEKQFDLQVSKLFRNTDENYRQHQVAINDLTSKLDKIDTNKNLCTSETYSKILRTKNNDFSKQNNLSKNNYSPKISHPQGKRENRKNNIETLKENQKNLMNEIINLEDPRDPNSRQTSSRTPPESNQSNGFLQFRRKKKSKVGTADINTSVDASFEGSANSQKKLWIFIKKVKDNATSEKIKNYLTITLKAAPETIAVKKVDTYYRAIDNNCFLIGVDPIYKNDIYNDAFWPKGVIYQRFDFIRGEKFLDNPKTKNKENRTTPLQSRRAESFQQPASFQMLKDS